MKLPTLLLAAALSVALSIAGGAASAHGPDVGPNGGPRADAGSYHVEIVLKGDEVILYVTDSVDQPVDVTGARAEATILVNKQVQKVALEPAGANTLRGQANLGGAHDRVKVVTALAMPGQKPVQARFEMGHAGH